MMQHADGGTGLSISDSSTLMPADCLLLSEVAIPCSRSSGVPILVITTVKAVATQCGLINGAIPLLLPPEVGASSCCAENDSHAPRFSYCIFNHQRENGVSCSRQLLDVRTQPFPMPLRLKRESFPVRPLLRRTATSVPLMSSPAKSSHSHESCACVHSIQVLEIITCSMGRQQCLGDVIGATEVLLLACACTAANGWFCAGFDPCQLQKTTNQTSW